MDLPKTSDLIKINIWMQNPSQDLKDIDVLCTFKIKVECKNLEYGITKDQ